MAGWMRASSFRAMRGQRGAPRWRQRAAAIEASAPKWIAAAMPVIAAELMLLIAWRRGYDAPSPEPELGVLGVPPAARTISARGSAASWPRTAGRRSSTRWRRCSRSPIAECRDRKRAARVLGSRDSAITRRARRPSPRPPGARARAGVWRDLPGNSQTGVGGEGEHPLASRWTEVAEAFQEELGAAGFLDEAQSDCAGDIDGRGR